MGSSKQTQTQQQSFNNQASYGWQQTPDTKDIEALRGFQFQADPRIPYTFARQRQQLHESYHNPMGGYSTPQIRDAALRAGDEDSSQNEAQAYREENFGRQALEYGKLGQVASLTAPRLTQTGSSGTGSGSSTIVQQESPLNSIMQGAAGMGSALLM